jgi:hypothetical protein
MYDGGIRRELAGPDITERVLIATALNVQDEKARGEAAQ